MYTWNNGSSPYLTENVYDSALSLLAGYPISYTANTFTTNLFSFDLLNIGHIGTGDTYEGYFDNLMISSDPTRNFATDTAACGSGGSTVALALCVKSPR